MLAEMTIIDEDALICDFAEIYHVKYDELPKSYAAVLAAGLPYTSRIMAAIRNEGKKREELIKRQTGNSNERIFDSPEDFKEALEAARRS